MGISPQITSQSWGVDNLDWLASRKGFDTCRPVTLDLSLFDANHVVDGHIPSGTLLGKVTATGLYGPYGGLSDEVQTITEGGSGLTSFTLTYSGQTTTSLDDQATAAEIQAALEALSNIAPGDVLVTGSPGGVYTVKFGGTLKNTNVAQMTATPTGGTGTVTIATTQAGGAEGASDGRETATGHLLQGCRVKDAAGNAFTRSAAAMLWEGIVLKAKLPTFPLVVGGAGEWDSNVVAELPHIRYE